MVLTHMDTSGTADGDLEHIKSCYAALGADKRIYRSIKAFL